MGEAFQIETARPTVTDEDFEELSQCYSDYAKKSEETGEKTLTRVRQKGEDDPTYSILLPAITAVTAPLKAAFEEFKNKIEEAREQSEQLKQEQSEKNEEALGTATTTTANASEVAEALKMFEEL